MPNKLAVCCGINAYGGGNDLYGCVNDAQDWSSTLRSLGYDVDLLVDGAATRGRILQRLTDMLDTVGWRGRAVFTFSGHGTWVPDADGDEADGRDEALCPVDYASAGLITDDDLFVVLGRRPLSSRVVTVLDSCHSGTATRALLGGHTITPRNEQFRERPRFLPPAVVDPSPLAIKTAVRVEANPVNPKSRPTVPLLAACAPNEVAWDANFAGRPRGAFTAAALATLNRVGPQNLRSWMEAIRTKLPSNAYPQTPQLDARAWQRYWGSLR